VDVTTVLGNLVDNAIDAARSASGEVKEVEVELLQEESTLFITVADSGNGVSPGFVDDLFVEGTTTKPDSGIPGGRGIGLALSRQLSRGLGGDLRLSSAGNPDSRLCGAEFISRLPGVMIVDDVSEGEEQLVEETEWTT
jgi:two-component system CitB family sensor kinase